MSQERADLNWYHKPPDYFAGRSGSSHERGPAESQQAAGPQQARAGPDHDTAAGDFTFDDFLDIINPLQHLPGISMVYRAVTGDEISPHARIIGGGLYGGGTGFVTAIANAISEEASGRDLGDNLIAAVFGEDETAPSVASGRTEDGGAGQSAGRPDPAGAQVRPEPVVGSGPEPKAPAGPVGIADAASEAKASTGPGDAAAPLEGKAALAALFSDLRGSGRPASVSAPTTAAKPQLQGRGLEPGPQAALQAASAPTSAPGPGPKSAPVAPRGGLALDPSLFASGGVSNIAPDGKAETAHPFTGQMLHGLQKYEELMTGRQVSQADIGPRGD